MLNLLKDVERLELERIMHRSERVMARRKKNRYRVKGHGMTIEQSLLLEFCKGKSDKEIIREILKVNRFYFSLESFDAGDMFFRLVNVRVHPEGASE